MASKWSDTGNEPPVKAFMEQRGELLSDPISAQPATVLVVEDEVIIRMAIADYLR